MGPTSQVAQPQSAIWTLDPTLVRLIPTPSLFFFSPHFRCSAWFHCSSSSALLTHNTLSLFALFSCRNSVSRDVLDLVNNRLTSVQLMVRLLPCFLASHKVTLACHLLRRAGNSCQLKTHSPWQATTQVIAILVWNGWLLIWHDAQEFVFLRLLLRKCKSNTKLDRLHALCIVVVAGWSKGGAIGLLLKQVCEAQAKQGRTLVCLLFWHFGPCLL